MNFVLDEQPNNENDVLASPKLNKQSFYSIHNTKPTSDVSQIKPVGLKLEKDEISMKKSSNKKEQTEGFTPFDDSISI